MTTLSVPQRAVRALLTFALAIAASAVPGTASAQDAIASAQLSWQQFGHQAQFDLDVAVYGAGDDGDRDGCYGRDHRRAVSVFQTTAITGVTFSDDPAFQPGPKNGKRKPTVDTVTIVGKGKWNGKAGYTFEAHATDQGEPGRHRDTFAIVVKDAHGVVVASVTDELDGGNIQSTRLR